MEKTEIKTFLKKIRDEKKQIAINTCNQEEFDYSQLFINLISKANFSHNTFIISKKLYEEYLIEFKKFYNDNSIIDNYLKNIVTVNGFIVSFSLDKIHSSYITSKIVYHFLLNIEELEVEKFQFFVNYLDLDVIETFIKDDCFYLFCKNLNCYIKKYIIKTEITNPNDILNHFETEVNPEYVQDCIDHLSFTTSEEVYDTFRYCFHKQLITHTNNKEPLCSLKNCISLYIKAYDYSSEDESIFEFLKEIEKKSDILFIIFCHYIKIDTPEKLIDMLSDSKYASIALDIIDRYCLSLLYGKNTDLKSCLEIFNYSFEKFTLYLNNLETKEENNNLFVDYLIFSYFSILSRIDFDKNNTQKNFNDNKIYQLTLSLEKFNYFTNNKNKDKNIEKTKFLLQTLDKKNYSCSNHIKLWFCILIFNFLVKSSSPKEILTYYIQAINKYMLLFIQSKEFYLDINSYIKLSTYFNYCDFSETFLNELFKSNLINSNLTQNKDLFLLKQLYFFSKEYKDTFCKKYSSFTIKLIQKCFAIDSSTKENCFNQISDKKYEYLNYAVILLDILASCSKDYELTYMNIVKEIPYKQKFYIFNNSSQSNIQLLLQDYLIKVDITKVDNETYMIDDLINFTIDVYNSNLNIKLAKDLLLRLEKYIYRNQYLQKKYQIGLTRLKIFDAFINEDIELLGTFNNKQFEEDRLYYTSILLWKKKQFEKPLQYMEYLVKNYPNKTDYKVLLLQLKQEAGKPISIEECDRLLNHIQEVGV